MTVKELIALLEQVEDKDANVLIAIGQHNKVYPVAYSEPRGHCGNDYLLRLPGSEVVINTSLPKGMHTVRRDN